MEHNPLEIFFKDKREELTPKQYFAVLAVNARYENAGIPKDYQHIYLDNSPAKDDQQRIYKILDRYVGKFTESGNIPNLYLYSQETGTGKTTTACAILNEYIRRRYIYLTKENLTVPETLGAFLDLNKMQSRYNLANLSKDSDELERMFQDIKHYTQIPFIVIDDIGVRNASESFRSLIHMIINDRITNQLPTVYTSNIHVDSLHRIFDERLQDRIKDKSVELHFVGESKRGRK